MSLDDFSIQCAAVIYDPEDDPDGLLWRFCKDLQAEGLRVGGVIQDTIRDNAGEFVQMDLVTVQTGSRVKISQNLGSGSASCLVDTQGVTEASGGIREAVAADADIILVSKFSGLEADGYGLHDDLLAAVATGLPVVVVVARRYRDKWDLVAGGCYKELPADLKALKAWWAGLRQVGSNVS